MIRQADDYSVNVAKWTEELPRFLKRPLRVTEADLSAVRATIRQHFDTIAERIG